MEVQIFEATQSLGMRYGGQHEDQPNYICLDPQMGELYVFEDAESGNVVYTQWEKDRGVISWRIPSMTKTKVNEVLEEIAPLAQKILDCDDETEARSQIEEICKELRAASERGELPGAYCIYNYDELGNVDFGPLVKNAVAARKAGDDDAEKDAIEKMEKIIQKLVDAMAKSINKDNSGYCNDADEMIKRLIEEAEEA